MAISSRDEAIKADAVEITQYLNSRGVRDHYYIYAVHPHSEALREQGRKNPQLVRTSMVEDGQAVVKTIELFADVAEQLDSQFRQQNSHGQIVVYSEVEQKQMALDLIDGKAFVDGGKVVKYA